MKRKLFIFLCLLLILPGFVFAQRTTGSTTALYTLKVTCNVHNAEVVITGDGINGVLQGQTPFSTKLKKEMYKVTVNAPGYKSQTKTVSLGSDKTINFDLESSNFTLKISCNVPGARVRIEGNDETHIGTSNMSISLPPDSYKVFVEAQGYETQVVHVSLSGNQALYFDLEPSSAEVRIILNNSFLNPDVKNATNRVKIYDNGQMLLGNSFNLSPGQHTFRVESGGIAFETTLQLKAGEVYKIKPYGGLIVNGVQK